MVIEILGVVSSLIYLYFSVRQKIWLWPFGIISSAFFIFIFFSSRFYADMGLQVYYLFISFYGWYHWTAGRKQGQETELPVSRISGRLIVYLSVIFTLLFIGLAFLLDKLTDSDVPWGDSFTTAGSIIATWMLARKMLEHWLLWVIIDAVAAGLYLYKGMYPTTFLYVVYAIIAVLGYYRWKMTIDS